MSSKFPTFISISTVSEFIEPVDHLWSSEGPMECVEADERRLEEQLLRDNREELLVFNDKGL